MSGLNLFNKNVLLLEKTIYRPELVDKINVLDNLGYKIYPDARSWLFEFACQYLEHIGGSTFLHTSYIPEIMNAQADYLARKNDFPLHLNETDISNSVNFILNEGLSLAINKYKLL